MNSKSKNSNPKQQYGDLKLPVHRVPPIALAYLAMGCGEGARKYGPFNWREIDIEAMTYIGAALRHIMAWIDGEDIDPESGNPHIAHAMASLAILADAYERGNLIDDRPAEGPVGSLIRKEAERRKAENEQAKQAMEPTEERSNPEHSSEWEVFQNGRTVRWDEANLRYVPVIGTGSKD